MRPLTVMPGTWTWICFSVWMVRSGRWRAVEVAVDGLIAGRRTLPQRRIGVGGVEVAIDELLGSAVGGRHRRGRACATRRARRAGPCRSRALRGRRVEPVQEAELELVGQSNRYLSSEKEIARFGVSALACGRAGAVTPGSLVEDPLLAAQCSKNADRFLYRRLPGVGANVTRGISARA